MINAAFGWWWIGLGFTSGALLGLSFQRADFLGGYDAWPRRLVRLGHIAFVGLGLINIAFALVASGMTLAPAAARVASWALIIGGVTMPLACFATAARPRLKPLFAIPVASLLIGSTLTAWGLTRTSWGAHP